MRPKALALAVLLSACGPAPQRDHCVIYETNAGHRCLMVIQGRPPKIVSCDAKC